MKENQKSFENKIKIGENIRVWRNLKGIKQAELAKKIGIS